MECEHEQHVKVARLEEQVKAADKAVELAAKTLSTWTATTDTLLRVIQAQSAGYITRGEAIASLIAGISLLGLVLKFLAK